MRFLASSAFLMSLLSVGPSWAQPAPSRAPQPFAVVVRDMSGAALAGVNVFVSSAATPAAETDAMGVARLTLPDGSHRLRFERDGFVGLEREVAVKKGQPTEIQVALRRAAIPPPVEAPPPPPPPAPAPEPPPAPVTPRSPVGVAIPRFLEDNFVGRAPLKESVLGCTDDSITRLLQLRDSLAEHTHDKLDEVLYVVAGEGLIQMGSRQVEVAAGWLSVVPRGVRHKMDRRGRNPLVVLSMLAGAPCAADTAVAAGIKE
jgi:mannose-6-phosphate isomerase-like protein (cupin superfamily)